MHLPTHQGTPTFFDLMWLRLCLQIKCRSIRIYKGLFQRSTMSADLIVPGHWWDFNNIFWYTLWAETPEDSPEAGQKAEQLDIFSLFCIPRDASVLKHGAEKVQLTQAEGLWCSWKKLGFQSLAGLRTYHLCNHRSHFFLSLSFLTCKMNTRRPTSQNPGED